jgi:cytochrome c-type biogenesis protein CcmE
MDASAVVHVNSSGVPPQMFRENGVVVEGTMVPGGTFESHRLMVSHSNQYEAPKDGHVMDSKELEKRMRTTEGL